MSDRSKPVVAVLGAGIMGTGMVHSLRRAGLEVRVWNRTAARASQLAECGARVEANAADAVRGANVIVTMLTDGAAVQGAIEQAAPGLTAGRVWLQTTTVGVDAAVGLAALAELHGLHLIDAPVLGSKAAAESGKLAVLAAGPEEVRATVAPVLDAIAETTHWLGQDAAAATGSRFKLVLNSWVLTITTGLAEAVNLSEALGLDGGMFARFIAGGLLDSAYLQMKNTAIQSGDFSPTFALANAAKDARLIVAAAEQAGLRLDVAAAVAQRMERAVEAGHGDEDAAAVYLVDRPA